MANTRRHVLDADDLELGTHRKSSDKRSSGWEVKTVRPEEVHNDPLDYFDASEVEKYSHSSGMRRAQERIAKRILELTGIQAPARILDMGCGVGYTTQFYKNKGYEVMGLDINTDMLSHAIQRGLDVVRGDMREISGIFSGNYFQGIVSASAFQWLTRSEDIRQVVEGINYVLKAGGCGAIQFYPKSEESLSSAHKIFERAGLISDVVVDHSQNQKRRMNYIVFQKH